MSDMKRREFIALLGGAATAWPLVVRAQQPAVPVVGFLGAGARGPLREQIAAFLEGLKESGYVEGQNVAVEYRFAEGQFDRFPALASDLVRRQVAVLLVASNAGALAERPGQFRSSSLPATIPSRPGSSRASTGPVAT
jgi:putative tryptophan/tyrosine transport system substrate-binding protein